MKQELLDGVHIDDNVKKIHIHDLNLAKSVIHPIWGCGKILTINRDFLEVKFTHCTKTFKSRESTHVIGDDLVDHLYLYPIRITPQ